MIKQWFETVNSVMPGFFEALMADIEDDTQEESEIIETTAQDITDQKQLPSPSEQE